MRKPISFKKTILAATALVVAFQFATAPTAQALTLSRPLLRDTFERYGRARWPQLRAKGPWYVQYDGYGYARTVGLRNTRLRLRPRSAVSPGLTHGAFVTSKRKFGNVDFMARLRTVKQLRRNSAPNPWEVGWVTWNYQHDHHFYYVILKPNGLELGKVDNLKVNPLGPECLWETGYQNCAYEGAQRYLLTDGSKKFPVGRWYRVRVRQIGPLIRIWVNGKRVATYADPIRPFKSGSVGLYTEDALVDFDNVLVRRPIR